MRIEHIVWKSRYVYIKKSRTLFPSATQISQTLKLSAQLSNFELVIIGHDSYSCNFK